MRHLKLFLLFSFFVSNTLLWGQWITSYSKIGLLKQRVSVKKLGTTSCRQFSNSTGKSKLVYEWKYNKEGFLTEYYEYNVFSGDLTYKRVYEYDEDGSISKWSGYNNGTGSPCYVRFFVRNKNGDVVVTKSCSINYIGQAINYVDDNSFELIYDEAGNDIEQIRYDKDKNIESRFVKEFASNGNLLKVTENKKGQTNSIVTTYEYGANNMLIGAKEVNGRTTIMFEFNYTMMPLVKKIETIVQNKINQWQNKGKFEKLTDYTNRVTEKNRNELINSFTQHVIDSLGSQYNYQIVSCEYDVDNEIYKITFENFGSVLLKIPQQEAQEFDKNNTKWKFINPKFMVVNDFFGLSHLEVKCKKQVYTYDINDKTEFISNQFRFTFDPFVIPVQNEVSVNKVNTTTISKSDVDKNIPVSAGKNINTYALIIGNEDYTKFQTGLTSEVNVEFARNDATVFSQYCEMTLGIPKENIVLLTDAISSQMRREIEKLCKLSKYSNGQARLIFYYAGHGFPDEQSKQSYIMPVDVTGINVTDGIQLSDLYTKLLEFPVQRVTVILDACFSGGGRNLGLLAARAVRVKPKQNSLDGNLIVFSASSGEQTSLAYKEKNHGMFTYFLLKKLQETKGEVSYSDFFESVKQQVQITSIRVNQKDQNPEVNVSQSIEDQWKNWKIK